MSDAATANILKIIERTRQRARDAENEFDRVSSSIQNMSYPSIDLFGGSAVSQVADIAAESKKACDSLYASYQSLIVSLDCDCRPLLSNDVDPIAVKAVSELIKWLNDESEIENNFTASFNGSNLGDVATRRYFPSIECKMIQKFWEDKYLDMPSVAEEIERKRREENELLLKDRSEKERNEARYQKLKEEYKNELRLWKEECAIIEQAFEKEVHEKVLLEKQRVQTTTDQKYSIEIERLHKEINEINDEIASATKIIDSLGLLAFGEKAKQTRIIKDGKVALEKLEKNLNNIKNEYSESQKNDEKYISDFTEKIKSELGNKYPLPPKPNDPRIPVAKRKDGLSPEQEEKERIKDTIIEFLVEGGRYTVFELQKKCSSLYSLSARDISSLLTELLEERRIERVVDNRMSYFSIKYI